MLYPKDVFGESHKGTSITYEVGGFSNIKYYIAFAKSSSSSNMQPTKVSHNQ